MTAIHQEIAQNSETRIDEEEPVEVTHELFHCTSNIPKTPSYTRSPSTDSCNKPPVRGTATSKKSNSGIPLRLKSATKSKTGTYRHQPSPAASHVLNKNTLEVQFMNNKKRFIQMHAELVDKQRPLLEMHKSLLRTKKQLEDLGKKVQLEDLKIVSLKKEEKPSEQGCGENPIAETAINLRNSIESVLEECAKVCKTCLEKRDGVVRMLESASKSVIEPEEIEAEVELLKKEKKELEDVVEKTLAASEKKIEETLSSWQKIMKIKGVGEETLEKIAEMEDTIKHHQKLIQEDEDNIHLLNRKLEERKVNYEKSMVEWQDKYNKLEDELKKEKKYGSDNLMKTRNYRGKVAELEAKIKEAEDKHLDATNKLKNIQEQSRKKEIQWIKEKEELKKNEMLLQQRFAETQTHFDTRFKEMESLRRNKEKEEEKFYRNFETQMEIREQEIVSMEKEKEELAERNKELEEQHAQMKAELEEKYNEISELSAKAENVPAIEYKPSESHWMELMEYKQKLIDTQNETEKLNEQINKMQGSLKAHAKLAAALKMEKDNAVAYTKKMRETLEEAKDDLAFKTRTIYKIHEKLVLKDKTIEKMKAQLKAYELYGDVAEKNHCQICLANLGASDKTETSSCVETEVGRALRGSPQYMSESLIGMSVKKVDDLRARLDNLKRMGCFSSQPHLECSHSSHQSCKSVPSRNLHKQIELRGKLYQILQKHADQSCEDFINLLKLTVSKGGTRSHDELNPSNIDELSRKFGQLGVPLHFDAFCETFKENDDFAILDERFEGFNSVK